MNFTNPHTTLFKTKVPNSIKTNNIVSQDLVIVCSLDCALDFNGRTLGSKVLEEHIPSVCFKISYL